MSVQNYKAGEKGLEWSPTMDQNDYEAGKSVRDVLAGMIIATLSQVFIFRRLDRWEKQDAET